MASCPSKASRMHSLLWEVCAGNHQPHRPLERLLIDATKFGVTCYNFLARGSPVGPQSEDCLIANVWTGANQTDELRPVMAFIYGGGFEFGSSNNPTNDGTKFAGDGVYLGQLQLPSLGTLVSSRFRNSTARVQTPEISDFRVRLWRCAGSSRILLLVIILKPRLIRLDRCHRRNEKERAVPPEKCGRYAQCFQRLLLSAVVGSQFNLQSQTSASAPGYAHAHARSLKRTPPFNAM
jgi:hypothetical protein